MVSPLNLAKIMGRMLCFLSLSAAVSAQSPQVRTTSVEALIYDLKHPESERRKTAAISLGRHKARSAVPALMEASGDKDVEVREQVLVALDEIADQRAVPAFIQLTGDAVPRIRGRAVRALAQVYARPQEGFIPAIRKLAAVINPFDDDYNPLVVEPYVSVAPEAIQALAARLKDEESGIREDAAKGLGILRGRAAVPALVEALKGEENQDVQLALIRSFYKIGDRSVERSIIPFIYHKDKRVHDEAILTVGLLRVREAVPDLEKLYRSGVEERKKIWGLIPVSGKDDLQQKVLQSLALIGDRSSEAIFRDSLNHPDSTYRQLAAEGFARLGDAANVTEVSRARIAEKRSNARLAQGYALYRMGRKEYLSDLVRHLDDRMQGELVLGYLRELESRDVPDLYPYLKSGKARIRARLVDVLGYVGDSSSLPELEKLLKDRSPEVVSSVNQAVRRIQAR